MSWPKPDSTIFGPLYKAIEEQRDAFVELKQTTEDHLNETIKARDRVLGLRQSDSPEFQEALEDYAVKSIQLDMFVKTMFDTVKWMRTVSELNSRVKWQDKCG